MNQILGEFINEFPPGHDLIELTFTPTSKRIKERWLNQRLSAHFLADYFTNFLPTSKGNPDHEQRIREAKGAASFIANELLENAIKYNYEPGQCQIKLGVHFLEKPEIRAVIFSINCIDLVSAARFKVFIEELLATDPEEIYIRQVERSAEADNADMSGLGFVTMLYDYDAQLGWKFSPSPTNSEVVTVTSMVQLRV